MIFAQIFITALLALTFFFAHMFRAQRVLNIGSIFNVYAFMYFVVGQLIYLNEAHRGVVTEELETIGWMCITAILGFNLAYSAIAFKRDLVLQSWELYVPSFHTLVLFTTIAIFAEVLVIGLVGPHRYFFMSRLDRFPIMKQYQVLLFVSNLANVCLPFFLARWSKFDSQRDRWASIILLTHNLLLGVLLISRSTIAFNIICILFFLEANGRLNKWMILCVGPVLALSMFFFKGFLYAVILGTSYETFNPGEFINWLRNSENLLLHRFDASGLPNNSYLLTLQAIVVPSPEGEALSEWYIREFHGNRAVSGLTYGFSGVIEGFLYAGLAGVLLHFGVIGVVFGLLGKAPGVLKHVFAVFLMFIMFRIFRSEIYNFTKTFAWYYFYQCLAIVVADILLRNAQARPTSRKKMGAA